MIETTKVTNNKDKEVSYFKLNNLVNIKKDGEYQLEKDKEAVRAFFIEHINPNTVYFGDIEEKLEYLVENNYLDGEQLAKYDMDFIKHMMKTAYAKKFRFKSFMGAYKFYRQYALKTFDGSRYLERYEDRMVFISLLLGQGDKVLAERILEELMSQRFVAATPTTLNAMKKQGEMVSCFLLDCPDSIEGIGRLVTSSMILSKNAGGVGINLSNLRSAGDPIKNIENASSGVVPVMKIIEDTFSYVNQLGQRNGAAVTYLNVFHPDIVNFLSTKKENADEKVRVKTLSLGLVVPDKYYELLKKDEYMYLFSPYDVERVYGKPFSYINITEEYENMVNNDEIKKSKVRARELEQEISKLQQESGYPYILNVDTANKEHNNDSKIIMSNLCSEILQGHEPSTVDKELQYEVTGKDVSCNLGSLVIPNLMKEEADFKNSVSVAVRSLTTVTDITSIDGVPTVKKGNETSHSIGVGALGLHTYLATNGIHYGSPESIELVDVLFRTIRFYALKESNLIAKERQQVYEGYENSKYADGTFFERYSNGDLMFKGYTSEKVKELFRQVPVPTSEDWEELGREVKEHGMYHAYLLTIPPTGSISYIVESSPSIAPITNVIEERQEKMTGKTYYPAAGLSAETEEFYKIAYDISMVNMIDLYASAQKHIDQGISMTLYLRSDIPEGLYPWKAGRTPKMTTRDLNILRNYAWKKGIKTIYYTRTFTEDSDGVGQMVQDIKECESCSV